MSKSKSQVDILLCEVHSVETYTRLSVIYTGHLYCVQSKTELHLNSYIPPRIWFTLTLQMFPLQDVHWFFFYYHLMMSNCLISSYYFELDHLKNFFYWFQLDSTVISISLSARFVVWPCILNSKRNVVWIQYIKMAVYILDALKTIKVAFHPPIGFSGTVMIQNDVRLHILRKLLWLSYVDDLK